MPSKKRPTTSQQSERPGTASTTGGPVTWAASGAVDPVRAHHLAMQHEHGQQVVDDDDEGESSEDDDGLFAYLPPQSGPYSHSHPQQPPEAAPPLPTTTTTTQVPPVTATTTNSSRLGRIDEDSVFEGGQDELHTYPLARPHTLDATPPGSGSSFDFPQGQDAYKMSALPSPSSNSPFVPVTLPGHPSSNRPDTTYTSSEMLPYSPSAASDMKRGFSAGSSVVSTATVDKKLDEDELDDEDEDSPYPEVRCAVSNLDDPTMPCLTVRMWVIGLILCLLGGAVNVFFNFRAPAPTVIPLVLLLISHPFGKLAAYSLPIRVWRLPRWLGGLELSLNPGPFNTKEHVLIYIMANVSISSPYALSAIVVGDVFYGIDLSFWFSFLLVMATQLTGFGLAGLCRRFLVWPASMIWPQNLVACTLINTLHADEDGHQHTGGISRFRFFVYAFIAAFFYTFLPVYLFTGLSTFSWLCWIMPKNRVVNQLFGVETGLGMGILTFDWAQISWIGSPLMVPWWAEVHVAVGFVIFYWIIAPIMYYTNTWHLAHFPMLSSLPYDREGKPYDIKRILIPGQPQLNETAYLEYSPLYMPAGWVTTYLLAFSVSTSVIVHTALYHGPALVNGLKRMRIEKDDIHAKLMRNYPEVPDWWYGIVFVFFFLLAVIAVEVWHVGVPVWALVLSLLLPVIYILPGGFIYAMTGQPITLNLLAQIIPGTLLPGNVFANLVFKVYAIQTHNEAVSFVADLKLGHYIKVPPRATFLVQCTATVLAAFVQVGVKQWMFTNVRDICDPHQKDNLTCPHNKVFYTASAIWGLLGPARQFGEGSLYHPELYALAFGAVIPIPFWLYQRRYPHSRAKLISVPVVLNGVSQIPPATGINYSSWFLVAFIFQYVVRRTRFAWWSKFNYVLSSAMDSGTVVGIIVIFFCLQFPKNIKQPQWWGNTVYKHTFDHNGTALRTDPIPLGVR